MQIRIAKLCDANQLAYVHLVCSAEQPDGFMFRLGRLFLRQYYRIFIQEKYSVIFCAEDSDGTITGFHTGTLRAEEHMAALRRHGIALGLAAIPALVCHPSLIIGILSRRSSISNMAEGKRYIITNGPRGEYWAWLPTRPNAAGAIALHRAWHAYMYSIGVKVIPSEVDARNKRVVKAGYIMGARLVHEFTTPDGRKRMIMEYDLDEYLSRTTGKNR